MKEIKIEKRDTGQVTLEGVKEQDAQKTEPEERQDISGHDIQKPEPVEPEITLTVAECSKFPNLGELMRISLRWMYDAEENFIDTVHEWLDGQCTRKQLEQEPCEVKGTREEVLHEKGIQTGGSGRNPCGDGTACRSAG